MRVTTLETGYVYIAYVDRRDGNVNRLSLYRSTDWGATFNQPVPFLSEVLPLTEKWDFDPYVSGDYRVPGFCNIAVDPTDPRRVYVVYTNVTGDIVNGD